MAACVCKYMMMIGICLLFIYINILYLLYHSDTWMISISNRRMLINMCMFVFIQYVRIFFFLILARERMEMNGRTFILRRTSIDFSLYMENGFLYCYNRKMLRICLYPYHNEGNKKREFSIFTLHYPLNKSLFFSLYLLEEFLFNCFYRLECWRDEMCGMVWCCFIIIVLKKWGIFLDYFLC